MPRIPLVAGNWKMNGDRQFTETLLNEITTNLPAQSAAEVLVCPAFPYLAQAQALLNDSTVKLGAQNVCDQAAGAYTGEVAASMLLELGCEYAIVGHSERRHTYKESNELVAARVKQALEAGLKPILCVGETLDEREAGDTFQVVHQQLEAVVQLVDNAHALSSLVVAYEPVWAIGTGKTATPEQAQAVHAKIRAEIAKVDAKLADQIRILYGGSVKPENAAELFAQADIDGALIGGASLKAASFVEIIKLCNQS